METKTLDDKVRDACHRIEELYNETDGKCYVSFSGGKDSTVLLALIKLCEDVYTIPPNAIPAVFSNTGIELGVTVDFVKWVKDNYYQNIQIVRPVKPFAWVSLDDIRRDTSTQENTADEYSRKVYASYACRFSDNAV